MVVGELVQDQGACCASHNTLINKLASEYPNCGLVSSQGLKKKSGDQYNLHFDTQGMREMGKRFAHTFLSLTDQEYIPRIGTVAIKNPRKNNIAVSKKIATSLKDFEVYTLNGKVIRISGKQLAPGNVYLLVKRHAGSTQSLLFVR